MSNKVKAVDVSVGDRLKLGRNKIGVVVENRVIEVPVTRKVKTSVLVYRVEGEDGNDTAVYDKHLSGTDKVELVPESLMNKAKAMFLKKNKKEPDILFAVSQSLTPFFVQKDEKKNKDNKDSKDST